MKIKSSMETENPAWRLGETIKWVKSFNNDYQLPEKKETKTISNNFFLMKKSEAKGSLAYCKEGYCYIHQIDQEKKEITVKLKENLQIKTFPSSDVYNEIPLSLKIMNNIHYQNETIIIPCNSTAKDLLTKIENSLEGEDNLGAQICFAGKVLNKTAESLEQLNIMPWSKILVIVAVGKPQVIERFTQNYPGWGFYGKIDGVAFQVNKPVIILGYGIYTPDRNETSRSMQLTAKFIPENNAEGTPYEERELTIDYSEDKIYKFMLSKPYRARANDIFSCILDVQKGYSFYGTGGKLSVTEETKQIEFSFLACNGSKNGTSVNSGQIPEIYYC